MCSKFASESCSEHLLIHFIFATSVLYEDRNLKIQIGWWFQFIYLFSYLFAFLTCYLMSTRLVLPARKVKTSDCNACWLCWWCSQSERWAITMTFWDGDPCGPIHIDCERVGWLGLAVAPHCMTEGHCSCSGPSWVCYCATSFTADRRPFSSQQHELFSKVCGVERL